MFAHSWQKHALSVLSMEIKAWDLQTELKALLALQQYRAACFSPQATWTVTLPAHPSPRCGNDNSTTKKGYFKAAKNHKVFQTLKYHLKISWLSSSFLSGKDISVEEKAKEGPLHAAAKHTAHSSKALRKL